jgi:hypothetical protein
VAWWNLLLLLFIPSLRCPFLSVFINGCIFFLSQVQDSHSKQCVSSTKEEEEMQQSIQRMISQVQDLQQEVSQLAQLAQQLALQKMNQSQQMQNSLNMNDTMYYQVAHQEQSAGRLLQEIANVCHEMNSHIQSISQQLQSRGMIGGTPQTQGNMQHQQGQQDGMMSSQGVQSQRTSFLVNQGLGMQGGGQQSKAPEGPVATDTTHIQKPQAPGWEHARTSKQPEASMSENAQGGAITSGVNQGAAMSAGASSSVMGSIGGQASGSAMSVNQHGSMSYGGGTQGASKSAASQESRSHSAMHSNQSSNLVSNGAQSAQQGALSQGNPAQSQSSMHSSQSQPSTSRQSSAGSQSELNDNLNEYMEDPTYSKYPYNRFTT